VQCEVVAFGHMALRVIRHPKCEKNDDENANGGTYKSEIEKFCLEDAESADWRTQGPP